jgi:hypothetical protein
VQIAEALEAVNFPAEQLKHFEEPKEVVYNPGEQLEQFNAKAPEKYPALHEIHPNEP